MKLSIEKLKQLLPDARPDRRGKDLRATCPWCGQFEFGISIEDNHLFGCYRLKKCGIKGNIFTLAKHLNRFDLLNIEGEVGRIEKLENGIDKKQEVISLDTPSVTMPLGWKRVLKDDYLDSRGFIEYDRYKVGRTLIDPRVKKNYVVTAIEEEGEIKAWIGRHVWDKKTIDKINGDRKVNGQPTIKRYLNSDADFGKLLFGYDEVIDSVTDTVIGVEGIFDKWNIDRVLKLHSQDKVKCNATFKCAISPEQRIKWMIKGVKNLILFYDPDVINEIKKTAAELQLYFNVLIAFNENRDKDAGDVNEGELAQIFSSLKTPTEFNSNIMTNKIIK